MTEHTILLETLLPVIWPLIVTIGGLAGVWTIFKNRMSQVRNFVVTLDNALKDDKLTKEEIRAVVARFTDILKVTS